MLWMGIWIHHHAVTTTLVGPDSKSQLKSWVTAWCQMKPLCSGWGSKHTWNASRLPSIHIKGVWQCSYAVDGNTSQSLWGCNHACRSRFEKSVEILGHCLVQNEALMQWLRLQTHMECFPPPLHTYQTCLTTFICCGWGYGSVIILLSPRLSVQICNVLS